MFKQNLELSSLLGGTRFPKRIVKKYKKYLFIYFITTTSSSLSLSPSLSHPFFINFHCLSFSLLPPLHANPSPPVIHISIVTTRSKISDRFAQFSWWIKKKMSVRLAWNNILTHRYLNIWPRKSAIFLYPSPPVWEIRQSFPILFHPFFTTFPFSGEISSRGGKGTRVSLPSIGWDDDVGCVPPSYQSISCKLQSAKKNT